MNMAHGYLVAIYCQSVSIFAMTNICSLFHTLRRTRFIQKYKLQLIYLHKILKIRVITYLNAQKFECNEII